MAHSSGEQSIEQLKQSPSPRSQIPLGTPQSLSQFVQSSPEVVKQMPSPQKLQSIKQLSAVSGNVQIPSPQTTQAPQSVGQKVQSSLAVQRPSPQRSPVTKEVSPFRIIIPNCD